MPRPSRLALIALCLAPATLAAQDWPGFRGPGAGGVADGQDLPVTWNVATGENVRFKTELPGLGHSSPIVWGGRVFLTSAETADLPPLRLGDEGGIALAADDAEFTWTVLAVDATGGDVLWRKDVLTAKPRARRHVKSSQANATPATDGEVLAAILGSEGLFVFDLDGEELWRADLGTLDPGLFGDPSSSWGYASSPIVDQGRVIVQVDRHANSFLAAYDAGSGRQLWKVPRDERPGWATPTIHRGAERTELVVLGSVHARGYDPRTGEELWMFKDEAEVKIPTPFVAGDRLILAGGYRGRPIHALPLGASGDLTGRALWTSERGGPYTSTPVAYRGYVFSVANEGVLNVWDLKTGERLHRTRTRETHSASIVASDEKLYIAGEGGEMIVVRASPELEELARNDMGDILMATPAISGGTLYVRTGSALYAIAAKTAAGSAGETAKGARDAHGVLTGEIKAVLYVSDVEKSAPFYRDVLGFDFRGFANSDGQPYYAEMAAAGVKFGLHEPTSEGQETKVGQQRLYFRVKDLRLHRSRVLAWGGDPGELKTTDWMDMFLVRDPDGNEIVFAVTDPERHSINPWNTGSEEAAAPRPGR